MFEHLVGVHLRELAVVPRPGRVFEIPDEVRVHAAVDVVAQPDVYVLAGDVEHRLAARTAPEQLDKIEGATDNEVELTRNAIRLIMRRQLNWDWLFLELRGGVGWPRRKLTEDREASPEIGIALEMQFGERDKKR